MALKLENGLKLETVSGKTAVIQEHLGEGGQGDVYRVEYEGSMKALKWYKPYALGDRADTFYQHLVNNINMGSPSPIFLWPLDLTVRTNGSFGYIMDLKPEGYYELTDFMLTNVRFPSFRRVVDVALNIVTAFRILHENGYSYQDMNDGNFFINPDTGEVLICDNDNVAPDGEETGILGKPRYMAPEIVMKKTMPNIYSDYFSMAVIIYILFTLNHPMEGKRSLESALTASLQEKLYGSQAVFMMDPENDVNAPDPKVHRNSIEIWSVLPGYVKNVFLRAFSQEALQDPSKRLLEVEWIRMLVRFRSNMIACSCGNEIFTNGGRPVKCEKCGRTADIPFCIEFMEYSIPGAVDSRIYQCQTKRDCGAKEALDLLGRVIPSKLHPDRLGLRNMGYKGWQVHLPDRTEKAVDPGKAIVMADAISFHLDDEDIIIRSNSILTEKREG